MSYDEFRERVMGWVRRRLEDDPGASDRELFREACERWPELEALSYRQFHVRYPIKVKKQLADEGGRTEVVGGRERWADLPSGTEKQEAGQQELDL